VCDDMPIGKPTNEVLLSESRIGQFVSAESFRGEVCCQPGPCGHH
jgi:hypothetical protein